MLFLCVLCSFILQSCALVSLSLTLLGIAVLVWSSTVLVQWKWGVSALLWWFWKRWWYAVPWKLWLWRPLWLLGDLLLPFSWWYNFGTLFFFLIFLLLCLVKLWIFFGLLGFGFCALALSCKALIFCILGFRFYAFVFSASMVHMKSWCIATFKFLQARFCFCY